MAVGSLFKTTARADAPFDGSIQTNASSTGTTTAVSDFLTVQSLTNFAVMTASIAAAWSALKKLDAQLFSSSWVPFVFAVAFGLLSVVISLDGIKDPSGKRDWAKVGMAVFIALINSLVLASAVIGTEVATTSSP